MDPFISVTYGAKISVSYRYSQNICKLRKQNLQQDHMDLLDPGGTKYPLSLLARSVRSVRIWLLEVLVNEITWRKTLSYPLSLFSVAITSSEDGSNWKTPYAWSECWIVISIVDPMPTSARDGFNNSTWNQTIRVSSAFNLWHTLNKNPCYIKILIYN